MLLLYCAVQHLLRFRPVHHLPAVPEVADRDRGPASHRTHAQRTAARDALRLVVSRPEHLHGVLSLLPDHLSHRVRHVLFRVQHLALDLKTLNNAPRVILGIHAAAVPPADAVSDGEGAGEKEKRVLPALLHLLWGGDAHAVPVEPPRNAKTRHASSYHHGKLYN